MEMNKFIEPKAVEITYETETPVRYETDGAIAYVIMDRPKFNNAQNSQMTYALDAAFKRAVDDDAIAVIVLKGAGKHFSAGHDIGTPGRDLHKEFDRKLLLPGHTNKPGAELLYTISTRSISACAGVGAISPNPPSPRCKAPALRAG
jgi:enoyl-CoA hydratase